MTEESVDYAAQEQRIYELIDLDVREARAEIRASADPPAFSKYALAEVLRATGRLVKLPGFVLRP